MSVFKQILGRVGTVTKVVTKSRLNAFDRLRADHMRLELALIQLRIGKGKPSRKKARFEKIKARLERHMSLEEDYLYPAAEDLHSLRELAQHAHSDHQLVKGILKKLEAIDPESNRFNSLVTKLIINLESHVMDEENELFPGLKAHLNPLAFRHLSDRILQADHEHRKHHHPHRPELAA